MDPPSRVALCGVGNMGLPIGINFLAGGVQLSVYNRTQDKASPLVERGAMRLATAAEAASAPVVVTMTSNDAALEAVVFGSEADGPGFGEALSSGSMHLCMATISPALARRLTEYHAARGAIFCCCPVFGRPDAAAARSLIAVLAGPAAHRPRAAAIAQLTAGRVVEVGEQPWQACLLKLGGNFQIMALMEGMAEAYALAEKAGVDRAAAYELYSSVFTALPVFSGYGRMIAHHDYARVGFSVPNGLKDAGLVLQAAGELAVPMPLAALVHQRLTRAMATGHTQGDWSSFTTSVAEDAGLSVPPAAAAGSSAAAEAPLHVGSGGPPAVLVAPRVGSAAHIEATASNAAQQAAANAQAAVAAAVGALRAAVAAADVAATAEALKAVGVLAAVGPAQRAVFAGAGGVAATVAALAALPARAAVAYWAAFTLFLVASEDDGALAGAVAAAGGVAALQAAAQHHAGDAYGTEVRIAAALAALGEVPAAEAFSAGAAATTV